MQEGLDLIVSVVREEDARAFVLDGGARKKCMACAACGGLDGEALLLRERGDIRVAGDALDAERVRKFPHELRIPGALRAQPVIEMHGDQFFETVRVQPVQQRDGIASAGDADELRLVPQKCIRDRERRD